MAKKSGREIVTNRKAYHDYEILETLEAGIVLTGTEIKSIREGGNVSIQEAYVKIMDGELWLVGAYIPHYKYGNVHNHPERRDRKLLVHKKEILSLRKATREAGQTVVPLALYFEKGRVKAKIGSARGKKKADKRATLKERDDKRRMERIRKEHR